MSSVSGATPPSPADDPLIGVVVRDRFRVEGLLASTGMGRLYAAHDVEADAPAMIEVLRRELSRDPEALERLAAVAMRVSVLGSPHVVRTLDVGALPNGEAYQALEHVQGRRLSAMLATDDLPSPAQTIVVVHQIANALAAAHAEGLWHLDLGPDKVLVGATAEGEALVKVLDFGVASVAGQRQISDTGKLFGNPSYMAPEQCRGRPADGRADIYALGCLMHELLTGKAPFSGHNPMVVVQSQISERPPSPSSLVPAVAEFDAVVARCLAKDPAERYATVQELLVDLGRVRAGVATMRASSPREQADAARTLKYDRASMPEWNADSIVAAGPTVLDLGSVEMSRTDTLRLQETSGVRTKEAVAPAAPRRGGRLGLVLVVVGLTSLFGALLVVWAALPEATPSETPPVGVRGRAPVAEPRAPRPAPDPAAPAPSEPAPIVEPAPAAADPPPEPASAPELLRIVSVPAGAAVFIDGTVIGNAPVEIPRPAERTRIVVRSGRRSRVRSIGPRSPAVVRVDLRR